MPIVLTTIAGAAAATAIVAIKVVLSCLGQFSSDVVADQLREGDGPVAAPVRT